MTQWTRPITGSSFAVQKLCRELRNSVRLELLKAGTDHHAQIICERQTRAVANYLNRIVEHSPREHLFSGTVSGRVDADGRQVLQIHITSEPDKYANVEVKGAA